MFYFAGSPASSRLRTSVGPIVGLLGDRRGCDRPDHLQTDDAPFSDAACPDHTSTLQDPAPTVGGDSQVAQGAGRQPTVERELHARGADIARFCPGLNRRENLDLRIGRPTRRTAPFIRPRSGTNLRVLSHGRRSVRTSLWLEDHLRPSPHFFACGVDPHHADPRHRCRPCRGPGVRHVTHARECIAGPGKLGVPKKGLNRGAR